MAKIISLKTAQLLPRQQQMWAYNIIDTLATREIADTLLPQLDADQQRAYAFKRSVQAPAFAMSQRGIQIDTFARDEDVKALTLELNKVGREVGKMEVITSIWDQYKKETGTCKKSKRKDGKHSWEKGVEDTPERVCTECGKSRMKVSPFNPNSATQVKHLFYDLLRLAVQHNKDGDITTDEDAIGRLKNRYAKHQRIFEAILEYKGLKKQLGFLKARLTPDNRYMTNFNIGVTWTDRWSSNEDSFHYGGNIQNISERHRHIFVPDRGYELCYADLKQAESNIVAHLAGDEAYIKAHEGDTHTFVCRMVWPKLPWTGDIKEDKKVAESHTPEWDNVPGHNYRYQSKAVQHGSNLGLTPWGLAIQRHISVEAATKAQKAYFAAFPGIRDWQRSIARIVHDQGPLVNPLGMKVRLFGRPWDDHTVKQGLAYLPQSTVAHIINIAVWRIWREMDLEEMLILLAQVHDALVWQHRPENREYVLQQAAKLMTIPIPITDIHGITRTTTIGVEAAVGSNWGHFNDKPDRGSLNLNGLKEVHFG